jgi:hypothetical protein
VRGGHDVTARADIVGAIKPYLSVKPDVRHVPMDEARHNMV